MPPLTPAQRAQGQWRDPGRWICLDGCTPRWSWGGAAAWRHHNAKHHPGPHPRQRGVEVIAVFETGRLDDTEQAISHDYVRQLIDRKAA